MTMTGAFRSVGLLGTVAALLLVQGCREDEQDRVLIHEKGVYQGQQDQPLEPAQREELRARARTQQF